MKLALCSLVLGDAYKKRMEPCTQSQSEYAEKHGYTRITDETVYDAIRPYSWYKIKITKKYLKDYDYLVWIDADVMITNQDRRIE